MRKAAVLPQLLCIEEVSAWLKVSKRTIWRWCRKKALPAPIKVEGSTRWQLEELERWAATRTVRGANADAAPQFNR